MTKRKQDRLTSLIAFTALLFLSACDKEKEPLPGQRETFIALATRLQPDPTLSLHSVVVPSSINLPEWSQVYNNTLHSISPISLNANPNQLWSVSIGKSAGEYQRLLSNIVVSQGIIYGIDAEGTVAALTADAKEPKTLWQQRTAPEDASNEALGGGVIVDGDKVLVSTSFGELLALDRKDGHILWRSSVNAPVRTAPASKNGQVFVTTIGNETFAFDMMTGKQLWNHAGITEQSSLLGGASPAVADNVVIVAYSSGEVYALQAENGQVLWSDTLTSAVRVDTVSSIPHIHACPVIDRGQVFVVSHGGKMISIDLKTGIRQWQREIGGLYPPIIAGEWLFILSGQNDIFCLQRNTGAIRWVASLPKLSSDKDKETIYWSGPLISNNELVFTGSNGQVQFLNVADGRPSKTLKYSGQSYLPPVIVNKTLYVLTDQADLYAWQ